MQAKSSRNRGSRKSSSEKIYSTFKPPENTEGNTVTTTSSTTGEFCLVFCPNFQPPSSRKLGGQTNYFIVLRHAYFLGGLFFPFSLILEKYDKKLALK